MATEKKYLDLVGLGHYDQKIKAYIDAGDKAISDVVGTVPAKVGETDTATVVAYVNAKVAEVAGDVDALADVATSGAAADVALADADGLYTATDVEGALKEIAETNGKIATAVTGEYNRATGVEGALTDLTTDGKTTLVAAINEVDAHADAAQTDATAALNAIGKASKPESAEGAGDGEDATGLHARLESLEAAVGEGGSVATQISEAIDLLDKDDTAVANQFVTAVSETNGVITVSRAALTADDIPALTLAKITDAGTAAAADVATVAIGTENEATDALPTVAQVKDYVSGVNDDMDERVEALESTHATKTVGTGEAAHTEYLTVAEEAQAAVTALVDGAPEALDTLKEIADWIANQDQDGAVTDATSLISRVDALDTAVAKDTLVVGDGKTATVQNAIDKAVADEATRINGVTGTPDTGKTLQDEIDAVETAIGAAKDGETAGTGLTGRIEALEDVNANADTYTAITENEIDALFTPAAGEGGQTQG